MGLQEFWFMLLAVLFVGFFVLEGFDFGVGMLMAFFGRVAKGTPRQHRRAVLNTIGPVWDGNEVWLITAGGAMFAAFPGWYATVFSGFYLPLLVILVAMILRVVAIEWRGKIDDPALAGVGRHRHRGRLLGARLPVGRRVRRRWCAACPSTPTSRSHLSFGDVLNPYTLLGGLATAGLFPFHGAVFVALKTEGAVRDDAFGSRRLALPVDRRGRRLRAVDAAGPRQGLDVDGARRRGRRAAAAVMLVLARRGDGWAFVCTAVVVVAVVVLLFGSLYPNLVPSTLNPEWSLTIYNASSTPYTLKIMTWAALICAAGDRVPGVDVLGVPQTHLRRRDTCSVGLSRRAS